METPHYVNVVEQILDFMSVALEDVKRCLPSHDKQCLKGTEKEFKERLVADLPLVTQVTARAEKSEPDKRLLMLVPSLQKIAQSMDTVLVRTKKKIDAQILFTDKGMSEVTQVIVAIKELARDAKDALATGNPRLKQDIRTEMEKIMQMADDFALQHQERFALGFCTPQASYLYVDMMDAFKRIARELVYLSEKG